MSDQYTLYGSPASLYTGKVRAYLNYKNIPYKEVMSSLRVYKKIIIPKTGVRFIPVVATPKGEFLQDSSHIIDSLEARFPKRSVYPSGPRQALTARLFELFGDEWLRMPAMHYRWNFPDHNEEFILHEFGSSVMPWAPRFVQRWLGQKVAAKFSGYVEPLGINSQSIPAIEAWYEELLGQLNSHFEQHDFLLGSCPSIGDYGLMGPLYAHLYRDPYPGQLMKRIAPNVALWVERMNDSASVEGSFLPNDEVPETLTPILQRLFQECWPAMETTTTKVSQWINENPGNPDVPRMLGMHEFTLGDTKSEQMTLSFSQWMMQRVLDCYRALGPAEKASADEFFHSLGAGEAMEFKPQHRVTRENNRLVAET